MLKSAIGLIIETGKKAKIVKQSSSYYADTFKYKYYYDKGFYKKYFEKQFLEETQRFYQAEAQKCLQQMAMSNIAYVQQAQLRFQAEMKRAKEFLDPSTLGPLKEVFIQTYLGQHAEALLSPQKGSERHGM